MIDKTMLIGALKNDLSVFQTNLNSSTDIGKLMGKCELTSQFISCLEEGRFDFVPKEKSQEMAENKMDNALKFIEEKLSNEKVKGEKEIVNSIENL